ncbi:MAG: hypothetical protein MdMp014T_0541 [Treponematales bacterium]
MNPLKRLTGVLAAALCCLGITAPLSATSPVVPPEYRDYSAYIYFVNTSSLDLFVEAVMDEEECGKVNGSFAPEVFCVEAGDAVRTTLMVIGEDNKASCVPHLLIKSLRFYDLATGAVAGEIAVTEGIFTEAVEFAQGAYDHPYKLTITDDLLGGAE